MQKVLENIFCYVIRHYGTDGISVLVYRQKNDDVAILCGDWLGNTIDLTVDNDVTRCATNILNKYAATLVNVMRTIRIEQAQFFFANGDEPTLVDIQLSANKLCGPGMVRDIFGKILPTQQVINICHLESKVISSILDGSGDYFGDIIIKPSKFRHYHEVANNSYTPMYVEVKR